jgi:hypothetical protein
MRGMALVSPSCLGDRLEAGCVGIYVGTIAAAGSITSIICRPDLPVAVGVLGMYACGFGGGGGGAVPSQARASIAFA